MENKQSGWEEELRKFATKYQKEHGLESAENVSPKFIWGVGFYEAVEVLIPYFKQTLEKEREEFLRILENNINETKWGDEHSQEVSQITLKDFIIAVREELQSKKQ